ncbi:MAG: hypothetical protein HZA52_17640 [Planctomycetes bacterium]|nr:hypothetical protein [Planctomycetota bacterium]
MFSVVLALSLAFSEPVSGSAPEVWLCVERGRAEVVGEGPAGFVDSLGAWRRVEGRGELRLDARASASLRWNGRGSLELDGPSRCEFDFDANGAPSVRLTELSGAHLEVRKGELSLELDGGWRARGGAGVLALDSRGSSGVHVERVVGGPVCFERAGPDPAHARRVFVEVGASVLLPLDPVAAPREAERELRRERAALWSSFAWPWSPEEDLVPSSLVAATVARADVTPTDVTPTDIAPADIAPADIAPAEVVPANIAPAPTSPAAAPLGASRVAPGPAAGPPGVAAPPAKLAELPPLEPTPTAPPDAPGSPETVGDEPPPADDADTAAGDRRPTDELAGVDLAGSGGFEFVPAAPLADVLAAAQSAPATAWTPGPTLDTHARELSRARAEQLLLSLLFCGFAPVPTSELAVVPIRRDGELMDTRFGARWRP